MIYGRESPRDGLDSLKGNFATRAGRSASDVADTRTVCGVPRSRVSLCIQDRTDAKVS